MLQKNLFMESLYKLITMNIQDSMFHLSPSVYSVVGDM